MFCSLASKKECDGIQSVAHKERKNSGVELDRGVIPIISRVDLSRLLVLEDTLVPMNQSSASGRHPKHKLSINYRGHARFRRHCELEGNFSDDKQHKYRSFLMCVSSLRRKRQSNIFHYSAICSMMGKEQSRGEEKKKQIIHVPSIGSVQLPRSDINRPCLFLSSRIAISNKRHPS